MVILLMSIHAVLAALIAAGRGAGIFRFPPAMYPALFFLPLWGPLLAIAVDMHVRGGEMADEEAGLGRFGITDEVYRSIRMDAGGVSDVLPIEDVLSDGTPVQRRSLLLSVLHAGPEPFVKPLRMAGINDDTEVVHYAVTALVELRSSYAQRLSEADRRLEEKPFDPAAMLASADLDEKYIRSGIPEMAEKDERTAHCRGILEKLLNYLAWQAAGGRGHGAPQAAADGVPDRAQLLSRLGAICLMQGDFAGAEEAGLSLVQEKPACEEGYLMVLDARASARDGRGVEKAIAAIRDSGVYLSPAGRRKLAFWE